MSRKIKRRYGLADFVFVIICILVVMQLAGCSLVEPPYEAGSLTYENYESVMDTVLQNIKVSESLLIKGEIPEFAVSEVAEGEVNGATSTAFMYELPTIDNYPLDVKGDGEIDIEVFVPIEDNGSNIRDLVCLAAREFNNAGFTAGEPAKTVSVSVRCLEASLAEEYIMGGFYYPDGYIAQNELYGALMKQNGIEVSLIQKKTAGNTMGIVLSKSKADEVIQKYGELSIENLVQANMDGVISIGYTNPTNNPTGLNFVVSMLSYFDASNPMSMEATTDFSNFQNTVTSVAFSTSQMRKALENGQIDAFVMERQAFMKQFSDMTDEYALLPFGARHDNPFYAIGEPSEAELEALKLFGEFMVTSESVVNRAKSLKFYYDEAYVSTVSEYSGDTIDTILEFWKTEKSSGKQILAMFIADRSGSMAGKRLSALKDSLLNAMQYIGEEHKVGLMSFESYVHKDLPLGEFTTEQQEYYVGAIDSWKVDGSTATNNAILVALDILSEEQSMNPNVKPIIFLLSDGETSAGYGLSSVKELIGMYDIPIYTIGYEANVKELTEIAEINGGTFINATSDDVGYILKTLFNAEI